MSWRRSLSFAENEKDLLEDYDRNGGSKYAKYCMRFVKKFENKFFIIPDGLNITHMSKPVKNEVKSKMIKLIQR